MECSRDCFNCLFDDCVFDGIDDSGISEVIDKHINESRYSPKKKSCFSNYYAEHREERIAYQKERYYKKREELQRYQREYYYKNRERLLAYQNLYNLRAREERRRFQNERNE